MEQSNLQSPTSPPRMEPGAGLLPQPTIAVLPPPSTTSSTSFHAGTEPESTLRSFAATTAAISEDANTGISQAANTSTNTGSTMASTNLYEEEDTSNDAAIAALLAAADDEDPITVPTSNMNLNANSTPARSTNNDDTNGNGNGIPMMSAPWQDDARYTHCAGCREAFHVLFNRRHHCRQCGLVYCQACTNQKALIAPSQIVLQPKQPTSSHHSSGSANESNLHHNDFEQVSFSPDPDPERLVTYVQPMPSLTSPQSTPAATSESATSAATPPEMLVWHGQGLEERLRQARQPQRVCRSCFVSLQPSQASLRWHNAHAMRYNAIDPTHMVRHWNSPIAHTLGHEIRKAAYTLNNLLPQPKRRTGALLIDFPGATGFSTASSSSSELQQCRDTCSTLQPNISDLDGVRIPATLLEQAKGVAVLTVLKGGFGVAGVEFGTGLVVARVPSSSTGTTGTGSSQWSAPSAIGTAGVSWGALIGAQVSDHVFLLMTDAAVSVLFSNTASVQLGADIGVAVGPVGRAIEGDWAFGDAKQAPQRSLPLPIPVDANGQDALLSGNFVEPQSSSPNAAAPIIAPIYTYSLSKGLYAGISLDGKVIVTRADVNEKFYGQKVSATDILAGHVPTPPAAQPLYDALQRCHVYASAAAATGGIHSTTTNATSPTTAAPPLPFSTPPPVASTEVLYAREYGEVPPGAALPTMIGKCCGPG
jgi:SH3 domain-containing YSC84-like protein 1